MLGNLFFVTEHEGNPDDLFAEIVVFGGLKLFPHLHAIFSLGHFDSISIE